MDWEGITLGGIGLAMVALLCFLIYSVVTDTSKEDFMKECMQDKKKYECTAMWRAGKSSVVPVFIPMSTGR